MIIRYATNPQQLRTMNTEEIRNSFLLENLFQTDTIQLVYAETDRTIIGGISPVNDMLALENDRLLASDFFLQRREAGVINLGHNGTVIVDGTKFELKNRDVLYIGRGSKKVEFESQTSDNPASFYFVSYTAHQNFPTQKATLDEAEEIKLGSDEDSNKRVIYKFIHPDGIKSCQLTMGFTVLMNGSNWNTMPPHVHDRRSEIYLYFDLPQEAILIHLLGLPESTRHMVVRNKEAIISPSWSIHSGVGTKNYGFVWSMGGENKDIGDINGIPVDSLR